MRMQIPEPAREAYLAALAALAPLDAERAERFPDMGRRCGMLSGREIEEWPKWAAQTGYEDAVDRLEAAEAALARADRMAARLSGLGRAQLAELAQLAIDRLDAIDGDCDLEPEDDRCSAGDDGCSPFWIDGRAWWGSLADAETSRHLPKPRYGVNQTSPLIPGLARAAMAR